MTIEDSLKGFQIIKLIGKGSSSVVYKVFKDNKFYAMKVIPTSEKYMSP